MLVLNHTPHGDLHFERRDAEDRPLFVSVVAATYRIEGERLTAVEAAPLPLGPVHRGDPQTTSLRREGMLATYKPRADIHVDAVARETVRVNTRAGVRHDTEFEMNCAGPEGPGNTIGRLILFGQLPEYLKPKGPVLVTEEWEEARQEALEAMKQRFDHPDFYEVLADYDPLDADLWNEMVGVQERFARGEPFYTDAATRTYSESMRQTLHGAVINLFEDPTSLATITGPGGPGLYDWYIRMHGTAFRANGAWNVDFLGNGVEVLSNTDPAMLRNAEQLAQGMLETDPFALDAAEAVRAARGQLGLEVSRRPGEPPRPATVVIPAVR